MGSNAAYRECWEQLLNGDLHECRRAARDLLAWLRAGNCPPEGKSRAETVSTCQDMVQFCTAKLAGEHLRRGSITQAEYAEIVNKRP